MAAVLARDPESLRPVMAALFGGHAGYGEPRAGAAT